MELVRENETVEPDFSIQAVWLCFFHLKRKFAIENSFACDRKNES